MTRLDELRRFSLTAMGKVLSVGIHKILKKAMAESNFESRQISMSATRNGGRAGNPSHGHEEGDQEDHCDSLGDCDEDSDEIRWGFGFSSPLDP